MKVVPRKSSTKVVKKSGSVIDRIKPVAETGKATKALIYGEPGTGKTVIGCSFPKPLLLIDIKEEGQDSVLDVEGVDLIHVKEWDDLEELYWHLKDRSKYKSVVLDQLTAMQALAIAKVKADNGQGPDDVLSQRSWGRVSGMLITWIANFRELEMNVCFNAHEKYREGDGEGDERIAPSIGANLMASAASFVNGAVGIIGNTYIREIKDKDNPKKKLTQFCLRVGPHAYYRAKIRRPVSAGPAPGSIINATFDKILKVSKGGELVKTVKRTK